jgi:hypothetical protein
MKRKIIPAFIGCVLSSSALAAQPTAERYIVSFPEGTHVKYSGAFASAFPNGLPVGIGSGLLFTGKQGDALTFVTVTDRGPNADSPKVDKNEAKIFVTPDFAPLLMTIRVQNGKAEAIDARPLHDDKGEINGLPLQSGVIGSTNEVAFSDTLKVLKGDNRGLDTEGITPDGKGGYWLCDEYGPFLINVDSKGKILAVHGPQAAEGKNLSRVVCPILSNGVNRTGALKASPVCRTGVLLPQYKARWISTVRVKNRRCLRVW